MPRPQTNIFKKYFSFDLSLNRSICKYEESGKACGKSVYGNHGTNLTSHIQHHHKLLYDKEKSKQASAPASMKLTKKQPVECKKIYNLFQPTIQVKLTKDDVMNACVELCSVNGRPFSIVEDTGFRKILDPILSGLNLSFSINRHNVKDAVLMDAKKVRKQICEEVADKIICSKLDGLTLLGRSFLGINIQFIENGKIHLRTLCVEELTERHTGVYLKHKVKEVLSEFNISPCHIYTCTTDNGANMLKCIEELAADENDQDLHKEKEDKVYEVNEDKEFEEEATDERDDDDCNSELETMNDILFEDISISQNFIGVRCAAHTLQLAIYDALKADSIKNKVDVARRVVKKLRSPNFRVLLEENNLVKPPIDCITRWGSTYKMLQHLTNSGTIKFIKTFAAVNKQLCVSDTTWNALKEIVRILKPFYDATIKLQSEQLTMGDFYGEWLECKLFVKKENIPFATNLLRQMIKREKDLFSNVAFLAAILLDPRWNVALHPSQLETAIHAATVIYEQKLKLEEAQFNSENRSVNSSGYSNASAVSDEVEVLLKSLDKSLEKAKDKPEMKSQSIPSMLRLFLKEKRVDRKKNVLEWWEEHSAEKPTLFEIAKIALAVPPTQVSVERLFSGAKFIMNPQRNRLDSNTFNAVMLIRSNASYQKD